MTDASAELSPSWDFAYLIGVIAGDGCITRAGNIYKLEIACDAAYPDLISTYQDLIARVTGLRVSVYKAKGLIETDGSVARVHRHAGWYSHVHFSAANPVIMAAFLRAIGILGYSFKVTGTTAFLSNTALSEELVADLGITKRKVYYYP